MRNISVLIILMLIQLVQSGTKYQWDDDKYDYIIVGAGTAGCVVANRLSENRKNSVLLLEAGISDQLPFVSQMIETPLMENQLWGSQMGVDWEFASEPQNFSSKSFTNQVNQIVQGRVLGGTSAINGMIYLRGVKADYDSWANSGLSGWSYDEILPYFQKSENNRIPELVSDSLYHNTDGSWTVEQQHFELSSLFIQAGVELGYNGTDLNGKDNIGFMHTQSNTRLGRRQSTSTAFLQPVLTRPNLHVRTLSQVIKILIGQPDPKAIGVQYIDLATATAHFMKARKEVIVCAGALNSPKLLMLSGIGDADDLSMHSIKPVVDLPVGKELRDHVAADLSFAINKDISLTTPEIASFGGLAQYVFQGTGYWASSAITGVAKIHSTSEPDEATPPDILIEQIASFYFENPDSTAAFKQGWDPEFFREFHAGESYRNGMMLYSTLLHPKSKGTVELRSADPFDKPKINLNYYQELQDITTMIAGIRKIQELVNTDALKSIGASMSTPHHPKCLQHLFDSDDYWECYVRHNSISTFHYSSTCKMGPVLDHRLRVRGVKRLRVVDASALPSRVSGGTAAIVVMVAEKASDMIKEDAALL